MTEEQTKRKWNWSALPLILLFLSLLGLGAALSDRNSWKRMAELQYNNALALQDSVRQYYTINGQLVYEKRALAVENEALKSLNEGLSDEVELLGEQVSTIQRLFTRITSATTNQPIIIQQNLDVDSLIDAYENRLTPEPIATIGLEPFKQYYLNWEYDTTFTDNAYRNIAGLSSFYIDTNNIVYPGNALIYKDETGMKISTGILDNDDHYEIFVTSDFPGFEVIELDGAILDKSIFGTDPEYNIVKIIPNISVGYGFITQSPDIYAGVGVGLDIQALWQKIFKK
jgi:hypothetical protein